ncbi:hypothetical protein TWF730_001703 [Orbilia blumenaviensis]|uniref:Uncharacterized protein n=1 Tax=Orbilia blumenaviensis TaxID=1796055 RepID=A0AAV9UMV5_9PEZI
MEMLRYRPSLVVATSEEIELGSGGNKAIPVQFGNSAVPWNTADNPDTSNGVAGAWPLVTEGFIRD